MYLNHFGLNDKPFKLAHDPAFYYPAAHQVPLNELLYSIEEHQGLATLIGEPGTGKTTLLRRILQSLDDRRHGILLTDAHLGGTSIFRRLETSVGAPPAKQGSGSEELRQLLARSGMTIVLLLDEAQNLTMDQYLELQYLTNLETPGQKLIEIIMTGQPLLEKKLAAPVLAALRQRATVRCKLNALDFEHARAYITHRLKVAGSLGSSLFTPEAIELIFKYSRGVPRLINIVCERCLIVGYVEEVRTIDEAVVEESVADQALDVESSQQEMPAQAVSHNIQQKMASRMESMEKKIDMLVQMMAESNTVRADAAEMIWAKRWFESLKRGPLILPAAKRQPVVAEEQSAKRWISSLKRLPNGHTQVTH